jgi:hypothetical protein
LVKGEETGQIPNTKMIKLKDFFALKSMFCPIFPYKIPQLFSLPGRQMVVAFPWLKQNPILLFVYIYIRSV